MHRQEIGKLRCDVRASAVVCAVVLWAVVAPQVRAHHSFAAEFDAAMPITVTGVVTRIEWKNPHAWFWVDVKDPPGAMTTNWGFEMGSPNGLMRAGWTSTSMKLGDLVTVEGSRARDGSSRANARAVVLQSTGQRLFAVSSGPAEPPPAVR